MARQTTRQRSQHPCQPVGSQPLNPVASQGLPSTLQDVTAKHNVVRWLMDGHVGTRQNSLPVLLKREAGALLRDLIGFLLCVNLGCGFCIVVQVCRDVQVAQDGQQGVALDLKAVLILELQAHRKRTQKMVEKQGTMCCQRAPFPRLLFTTSTKTTAALLPLPQLPEARWPPVAAAADPKLS